MLRPDVVVVKRTPQAGRRAALPASSLFAAKPAAKPTPKEAGQGLRRNLSFGSTGQRGSAPRRSGGSPPPPPGEPPRRSPSFERSPSSRRAADPCSPTAAADAPSRSVGKLMRFEASGRRRKTQSVGEPLQDATL